MLAKTTGRPSSRRRRAQASPWLSPGSITAASTSDGPDPLNSARTGSCPARLITCSKRERMSAWGSMIRIRATKRSSSAAAGIRSACEYEYGVNDAQRILVVDDDEDIRILLRELPGPPRYRSEEAADDRPALRQTY